MAVNCRVFGQPAQAVAEVAYERLQPRQSAPLAISLPGLLRAAEANERLAAGFLGTQTGADAVVGVHRQVAGEFGLEVTVALRLAQQPAKTHP